jgi:hypothetical protein
LGLLSGVAVRKPAASIENDAQSESYVISIAPPVVGVAVAVYVAALATGTVIA